MIELYNNNGEIVEAVELVDTMGSILECVNFIVGTRHDYRMTDTNSGIIIKFPGLTLRADYGTYIVKDTNGGFNVVNADIFETQFCKVVT